MKRLRGFAVICTECVFNSINYSIQGLNVALGVLNLAKAYTPQRLERACQRCIHFKTVTYRSLKSVLQQSLDLQPLTTTAPAQTPPVLHDNLRRNFNDHPDNSQECRS